MRKLALGLALLSLTLATAWGAALRPDSGATTVLTGTVGTVGDPDAPVITLTDDAGQPVTTLPAGPYQIQVSDLSAIHNFHLKGGTVDEATTVPEITDITIDVTLEPGAYTFVCDPHSKTMVGHFSVT